MWNLEIVYLALKIPTKIKLNTCHFFISFKMTIGGNLIYSSKTGFDVRMWEIFEFLFHIVVAPYSRMAKSEIISEFEEALIYP